MCHGVTLSVTPFHSLQVVVVEDAAHLFQRIETSAIGGLQVFPIVGRVVQALGVAHLVTWSYQVATKRVRVCVELLVFHRDDKRDRVLIGCNTDKMRVNDSGHDIILSEWWRSGQN